MNPYKMFYVEHGRGRELQIMRRAFNIVPIFVTPLQVQIEAKDVLNISHLYSLFHISHAFLEMLLSLPQSQSKHN